MLKCLLLISCVLGLYGASNNEIISRAIEWYAIQQRLMIMKARFEEIKIDKEHDNQEFFNIQQQLGAIYLAQKRFCLGFGTALLPTKSAVQSYVRKKTFLNLKTKELFPMYKKSVVEYQKKHATGEFEHLREKIRELEALDVLHLKLFYEQHTKVMQKKPEPSKEMQQISSIESHIRTIPAEKNYRKSNCQLNWITPVAGIREGDSEYTWKPYPGAVVLCPDTGIVRSIVRYQDSFAVFIKQDSFTYVVSGIAQICVNVGDNLKQGRPIGFCDDQKPCSLDLQLWRDDIALNPGPYHKALQL